MPKKSSYTRDLMTLAVLLAEANVNHKDANEADLGHHRREITDEIRRQSLANFLASLTHNVRRLQVANEQHAKRTALGQQDAAEVVWRRRQKLREACLRVKTYVPAVVALKFSDDWESPPLTVMTSNGLALPWPVAG